MKRRNDMGNDYKPESETPLNVKGVGGTGGLVRKKFNFGSRSVIHFPKHLAATDLNNVTGVPTFLLKSSDSHSNTNATQSINDSRQRFLVFLVLLVLFTFANTPETQRGFPKVAFVPNRGVFAIFISNSANFEPFAKPPA